MIQEMSQLFHHELVLTEDQQALSDFTWTIQHISKKLSMYILIVDGRQIAKSILKIQADFSKVQNDKSFSYTHTHFALCFEDYKLWIWTT